VVLDEGVATIELLKFGKEAGGDVSGPLQRAKERLNGFLPCFDISSSSCGLDLSRGTETLVLVDLLIDIERFHHNKVVLGNCL